MMIGVEGHTVVSRDQPGVKLLRDVVWQPNLVRGILDRIVVQVWGRRSCRGQLGTTRGQVTQECRMTTKCCRKTSLPKISILMGSKVMWGQLGSIRGQIA